MAHIDLHMERRDFLRVCAIAGLGCLLPSCAPGRPRGPLRIGDTPPAVTLKDLKETSVNMPADVKGKVSAIHFWASWCSLCLPEMVLLESLYGKFKDKGFLPCSVALGDSKESVESYLGETKVSYPILVADVSVAKLYGVFGVPTTYVLGRDNIVRSRIVGAATRDAMENIVKTLL
jgi:cytochrome c biogenesis protein CcmG, thiol:disulfide interchange protein DsbE